MVTRVHALSLSLLICVCVFVNLTQERSEDLTPVINAQGFYPSFNLWNTTAFYYLSATNTLVESYPFCNTTYTLLRCPVPPLHFAHKGVVPVVA